MKTLVRTLTLTAVLVALTSTSAFAQATLRATTLTNAITATQTVFDVASGTGVAVGDIAFADREGMTVTAISGNSVTVRRGVVGIGGSHAAAQTIYIDDPDYFEESDVAGTCVAASQKALPRVSLSSGIIYQCSPAGVWYRLDEQFRVSCNTGVLATGSIDQTCWQARGNYVITAISYVSTVAESAGTLTVIPRRQEGTEAAASGDALATALSGVSTVAQTVTAFTLTATSALLLLDAGDRLGIDFTDDVAGELAGVNVTFTLAPR